MDFTRAFSFAFQDRDWVAKLLVTFAVTLGAVLLTPVLVGLALWAALLAYQADIVRGVRLGLPQPLPAWSDFGGRIARGLNIFAAVVVYNLPNLLLGSCSWLLTSALSRSITGTTVTLGIACCLFPMLIIYNVVAMPMLALGIARFAEEVRAGVLFDFPTLFGLARSRADVTIQYLLLMVLANLLLGLIAAIPCAGWLAAPALLIPVHGHLMGQYAARVLGRPRRQPAPAQPSYRR